jgi:hypothetical protein
VDAFQGGEFRGQLADKFDKAGWFSHSCVSV